MSAEFGYPAMKAQVTGDVEEDRGPGAMETLDVQLEMFEKDIAVLEARLGPILHQYDTARLAEPRPEPSSQLRARVERLAQIRAAMSEIISRVDL